MTMLIKDHHSRRLATLGLAILAGLMLDACYATGMNMERVSAHAIIPTPYPDSVKISDVHQSLVSTTWVATTPQGVFDCSLASGEREALCAKRHP